ncbi:hypothetical protein K7X08_005405 [Anisodus acutangulus]|uniref:Uncharacterized protein n=1 Tax=Anisodus acutangulus TaxID=402998 RepID=A0A9Q1R6B7_9SOLA|nr:hypothetical protein K7X08_005405 [Anisodus acutangulus]
MGGYQLLNYYNISRVSRLKLLARPFVPILRMYTKENYEHHAEEKAPTTAEEFVRVAEEMAEEKAHQGFDSQTVDKAKDAMKEATTTADSNFESVNENFKEDPSKGNFHNKGDDLLKTTPNNQISS